MELTTDSSRALLCSSALVLLLLSSASTDESIRVQRDVSSGHQIVQVIKDPSSYLVLPTALPDSLPHGPAPPHYPVKFPVARPSSDNILAICLHGERRPRYQSSDFPASGFDYSRRQANAVNYAESWFSTCCKGNETWGNDVTLCCATQAWEKSVQTYCEESASFKDHIYNCCMIQGSDRLSCFHSDAPNPDYGPTEKLPVTPPDSSLSFTTYQFNFERSSCQSSLVPDGASGLNGRRKRSTTSQKVDMNFPPGRPRADAIESLCNNQKLRELYTVNCLPRVGYEQGKKRFPISFALESFVSQCCPLPDPNKTMCFTQILEEMPQKLCESRNPTYPPALRSCCRLPPQDVQQCINEFIIDAVTEASNTMR